jgi:TPR repeat protein
MEFLQGRSLEDILKNEKTMPLEKRLDIVAQVCRGLDYAHARGIVHRDIKPANVMVTTDGVAKVVDFGIARLADQKLTNTGHVLGTVSYMSPEQLQGKVLDGRSDIFAVGVMLFETLTSVLPFAAEDTGAAITNTLYRQPPSLASFLANYPKELDEIVSKCLAKDPAERFQTAGELADRLTQVQQEMHRSQIAPTVIRTTPLSHEASDESVRPFPPPLSAQQVLPKTRRNIVIAIIIGLLILGVAVGVHMLQSRSRSSGVTDITELRKRANSGDAAAQDQLGRAYREGQGIQKDYGEAAEWFRKAAEHGNSHSQAALGALFANGLGMKQDDAEASRWFVKAAEQGEPAGQYCLGVQYEHGRGVSQDIAEAVRWYRKAAEQNYPGAEVALGNAYKAGKGVPHDDSEAVRWYRKAADQGDAGAQYNMAGVYWEGRGVAQDYTEAAWWYRKAADQGNAHAQVNLAIMYADGRGVAQDYSEAVQWYRKAADQGDARAQYNLGVYYGDGRGVAQDYTEAARLYRKAADQGNPNAQNRLGALYELGQGVPRDYAVAANWYRKAADQGNADAQENLKRLQRDGRTR